MSTTRIGSFNVENMFERPKVMGRNATEHAAPVLAAHARFNELIAAETYTPEVKEELKEHLATLQLLRGDRSRYAVLRRIRGRFLARHRTGETSVVASGRESWVGWVELTTEPISELATRHTAQVMRDVGAHVLGVVEAESRELLHMFSASMLKSVGWTPYEEVHLIDGNDERGINVGLLTRDAHQVITIRTHVYARDNSGVVFSRDCAEYHVRTPAGPEVVVLVNHLKSKGYGAPGDPIGARRRFRQAVRIARIVNRLRDEGHEHIAVVGDLNDTADSEALRPLFQRTGLRDISEHDDFDWDHRRGTYRGVNERGKIDYVLLTRPLFAKAVGGGVFRKGVWRGPRTRNRWEVYETLTDEVHAASDHAAIYADIDWTR
ncbi:endonuclease/exonuclease/phosphatase family protein [Lentzea sp. DG1S-22]|uniref:endonuclease/exonuclease/phosphatase family protein n=1 Tax=Lentzea sp. DG1S-22 TaxID=3108822 RepID=UPI002E769F84|nr:endonuclease/exonuclease/phosphatase family protein [Lentzea sp. DG1S-22]WVH83556.1 endonuclease/exonuclease/phosphatase family protein [Lentzea sp. DG1S-22]